MGARLLDELGVHASRDLGRQPWRTSSEFYHGSGYRGVGDEFISLPPVLQRPAALTSIGDRPLIVVTAVAEADPGWVVA